MPNNIPQVNMAVSLVLSAVQKMSDRITAYKEKHLITKTRDLGWNNFLDKNQNYIQFGLIFIVEYTTF